MGKNPAQKIAKKNAAAKDKAAAAPEKKKVAARKKAPKISVKAADKHCKIASCKREYRAKGYCGAHYAKWRHGEYGVARFKSCREVECKKPMALNRHGYCEDHFQSYYVKGVEVPHAPAAPAPKAEKKEEAKEKVA